MSDRTLREALRRSDLLMLRAIGENWGVIDTAGTMTATRLCDLIVPAILNSDSLRAKLANGPNGVDRALSALLRAGGKLPKSYFSAEFGTVQAYGSENFLNAAPWRDPGSVTEWLLYHGLIFPGYADVAFGIDEFYLVPKDLIPFFETPVLYDSRNGVKLIVRPAAQSETAFRVAAKSDFYDLACLVIAADRIAKPVEMIRRAYSPSRVDLCRRVLMNAEILKPNEASDGDVIQSFISQPAHAGLVALIRAWINDSLTDEIGESEIFRIDPTFKADLTKLRKRILSILGRVESSDWISFRYFVAILRSLESDLIRDPLRTPGWMIENPARKDRASWDAIEGEILRLFFRGPLHDFGFIDLAFEDENLETLSAVRVTSFGKRWLAALRGEINAAARKRYELPSIGTDGLIRLTPKTLMTIRYHLARYCDWEEIRPDRWTFRISPASLRAARNCGLKIAGLTALMRRAFGNALPPSLLSAIENWDRNETEATAFNAILVSDSDPNRIGALIVSRDCAPWVIQRLNPTTIMIKPKGINAIRRKLAELGVLLELTLADDAESESVSK